MERRVEILQESESAYQNLICAANSFSCAFASMLKPFKISEQQYNVLKVLYLKKEEPCTLSYISSRMLDKMSNATRLVDKLLEKEYVTRELCKDNRRKVDIQITEKGIKLVEKIQPIYNDFITSFIKNREKVKMLTEVLEEVATI